MIAASRRLGNLDKRAIYPYLQIATIYRLFWLNRSIRLIRLGRLNTLRPTSKNTLTKIVGRR
jgi:hypothetical protein